MIENFVGLIFAAADLSVKFSPRMASPPHSLRSNDIGDVGRDVLEEVAIIYDCASQ